MELHEKRAVNMCLLTFTSPRWWKPAKNNWDRPAAEFGAFLTSYNYNDDATGQASAWIKRGDCGIEWKSQEMRISRAASLAERLASRVSRYYHLTDAELLDRLVNHPRFKVFWLSSGRSSSDCVDCKASNEPDSWHNLVRTPYGNGHILLEKGRDGKPGYTVKFGDERAEGLKTRQVTLWLVERIRTAHRTAVASVAAA